MPPPQTNRIRSAIGKALALLPRWLQPLPRQRPLASDPSFLQSYRKATEGRDLASCAVLHYAPELSLQRLLRQDFGVYTAAGPAHGGTPPATLDQLPFLADRFDAAFIHLSVGDLKQDWQAVYEICRVVKPDGFVFLFSLFANDEAGQMPPLVRYREASGIDIYVTEAFAQHYQF